MDVTKIQPVGDRILVRIAKEEKQTMGGIIIPGGAEKPTEGAVIDFGDTVDICTVGDTLLLSKGCGVEIEEGGVEYRIIETTDVLAVIN